MKLQFNTPAYTAISYGRICAIGGDVTLHHGDNLAALRTLPDASVDSIVTDPPYGMERDDASFETSVSRISY